MSARNKRGPCSYCGKERKLTDDHVPPKLLLERPFPINLLTVRACGDCNAIFKADDEYTRTVLTLDLRANWNYAAQSNVAAVIRSLQRPDARGFAEYLNSQTHVTKLFSPGGQRLTRIEVDTSRVNATGMHILRGLYFYETRKRLPLDTALVRVGSKAGLTADHPDVKEITRAFSLMPNKRNGTIGTAFGYLAALGDGMSFWLMLLYDFFFWLGTVDERDEAVRLLDNSDQAPEALDTN
jgi:hypothetical protein